MTTIRQFAPNHIAKSPRLPVARCVDGAQPVRYLTMKEAEAGIICGHEVCIACLEAKVEKPQRKAAAKR